MESNQTQFKPSELGLIPKDWEILKIMEIGKVITGKTPSSKNPEFFGNDLPFITPTDFSNYIKSANGSVRYLSAKGKYKFKNLLIPQKSVLVTCIGSDMGKVAIVSRDCITNQQINSIIINDQQANPDFIYYNLKNKYFLLRNLATGGSTMPIINKSDFENIKLTLPPLPEQQKIAEVLGSLDDMIELLRRQNQTLESLGQAIFEKWFVNEKNKKWQRESIISKNLAHFIKPGIDKFENEKIYLATADVTDQNITNIQTKITYKNRPSRANMQPQKYSIWFAKMQNSRKILMFDEFNQGQLSKYILSTGFAGLKTNENNHYYLWNFILGKSFDEFKNNLAQGAVQIAINNESIEKIKIIVPDLERLNKFNRMVKSLFGKIYINKNQIETLSQLRDSLLPKLMSGKVRII